MALAVPVQNTPGNKIQFSIGIINTGIEITATNRAPNPALRKTSLSRTAAEAKSIINRG